MFQSMTNRTGSLHLTKCPIMSCIAMQVKWHNNRWRWKRLFNCYKDLHWPALIVIWSLHNAWWRYQIQTSSVLLAHCEGNPPVTTKASDADLWCFLWCSPVQTVEQTLETPVIWDAIAIHYDVTVILYGPRYMKPHTILYLRPELLVYHIMDWS